MNGRRSSDRRKETIVRPIEGGLLLTPTPGLKKSDPVRSQFQTDFPPEEFAARRARVFDAMEAGAYALLQGAPPVKGFLGFRQTNDFYYMSGVELPQAYLLLDGSSRKTILYLPHREREADSEGAVLGAEDADVFKKFTGVDEVCGPEALAQHLAAASIVYTPHSPAEGLSDTRWTARFADQKIASDPWDGQPSREQRFIGLIKTRFPKLEVRDLTPVLDSLRSVKSPRELELMRKAGRMCGVALREAMRATTPGIVEYQLGAIAEYIYRLYGARGDGYRPIIAGGPNIWFSHYFRNNCVLKDGDLVLMDGAPDLGGYTSDIGRIWPVNGHYSPWQRELYGWVVEYHKAVLGKIRPGVTSDQVMDEAAAQMNKLHKRWKWSKDVYRAGAERTLSFRGHLSHPVGMAVHDDGGYFGRPMVPGMVFSVDPQMWIPEEKLYIRVEDTVAVTEGGVEVLTTGAPLEMGLVEQVMSEEAAPLLF